MNHKRHYLKDLDVEGHQIEEALRAILHSIIFLRAKPKYTFKGQGSYLIGTVGYEDVDCDCIDVTYTRIPCKKLQDRVHADIKYFCDTIRARQEASRTAEPISGEIVLQFYQINRTTWPLAGDPVPWEDWVVPINLVSKNTEKARQSLLEKLAIDMRDIIFTIIQVTNNDELYTPKDPKQEDLGTVFDTSFDEFQSYLFKISCQVTDESATQQGIVGATVKRIAEVLS